jgi:hypothetical protein
MRNVLLLAALLVGSGVEAHAQTDAGTSPTIELDIQPDSEQNSPARVSVESEFTEPTGNGRLDAGETGALHLSFSNRGDQGIAAASLALRLETPVQNLRAGDDGQRLRARSFVEIDRLQQLAPGGTDHVVVPLHAPPTLPEKALEMTLAVRAPSGSRPAGRKRMSVPTGRTAVTPVVDRQIPKTTADRPDAVAVVIGNKTYQTPDIPNVDYALRDARTTRKYLIRTLGFREENIIFTANATGSDLQRILGTSDTPQGQLYNWVKPGESDVFVYYSGHGAPAPGANEAYLVASDTNPNYLSINGYSVEQLYENLSQVPARSVTVVLEACFSGISSDGGAVVQDASPVELSVENPVLAMENGLAFTAGVADQIASWYPEKKHGLFTYFFLKGLRGEADRDGNRAITGAELERYVREKVPYRARRMYNREQTPQVVGQDKDRALVRYDAKTPQN